MRGFFIIDLKFEIRSVHENAKVLKDLKEKVKIVLQA